MGPRGVGGTSRTRRTRRNRRNRLVAGLVALCASVAPHARANDVYLATASCAWAKPTLDVQIIPSPLPPLYQSPDNTLAHSQPLPEGTGLPWENAYTRAALEAVYAWDAAIRSHAATPGAEHLSSVALRPSIVAPGVDPLTLPRPDIRIAFDLTMGTTIGVAVPTCAPAADVVFCDPDGRCRAGSSTIVIATWLTYSFTSNDVYNIVLHEMGHALGLDHVVEPETDIMAVFYPYKVTRPTNPRMCLSTLNLQQIAESFRWLAGAAYRYHPAGVSVPRAAYAQAC